MDEAASYDDSNTLSSKVSRRDDSITSSSRVSRRDDNITSSASHGDSNTSPSRIHHRNSSTSLSRVSRRDDNIAASSRVSRRDDNIASSSRVSRRNENSIASSLRVSRRNENSIASSSRVSRRNEDSIASSSRVSYRNEDSMASSSRVSRRNEDDEEKFTALLLRLSQAHTNQVKELQLKLESLQRRYNRLNSGYKENYDMTRASWDENKILRAENERLRRRLAKLERRNAEKSRDSDDEEEQDGTHSTNQDGNTTKPTKVNKLSKTRSNKRVRYSEVDPSQSQTSQRDVDVHKNKRSHKERLRDADDAEVIDDAQVASTKKSVLVHDLMEQNSMEQHVTVPVKILAPETCHPSGEVKYSVDLDDDLYAGGDNRRQVLTVPETLAVPGNFENSEFMEESGFDPPTCASTPRNESQSSRVSIVRRDEDADQDQESLLSRDAYELPSQSIRHDQHDDHEHQSGREVDNDETCFVSQDHRKQSIAHSKSHNPEFDNDETRFESQTHQRPSHSRSERQYPVVDNDETRFVDQDHQRRSHSRTERQYPVADNDETRFVSQDHRRRSLPRSESQYPVDLSSTQVPSPTFCGGNDDEDDDDGDEVKVVLDIERASTSHEICVNPKTPQSIRANDSSCQSEASLLLLQRPQEMMSPSTPTVPQEEDAPSDLTGKRLESTVRSTSAWKPNPRKRKNLLDDSFDYEVNDNEGGASSSRNYQHSQRLDDERIENDQIDIDADLPDKENSPPSPDPCSPQKGPSSSRRHKPSNKEMDTHGKLIITKPSPKGSSNKVFKQSKLSSAMFQTKSRTENTSLIAQYNGIGQVNLDSQRDESLAKAIELSILENMDSLKNDQDERERGKKDGDFKIPSLPNLRKSPRKRGDKEKLNKSASAGMHERTKDELSSLGKSNRHKSAGLSEEVVFDVIDDDNGRGGTVSKLSRKKRRTARDHEKSERTARDRENRASGVENGEKAMMEEVHEISDADEDGNNSCADLFEDDAGGDDGDDVAMVTDEDAHEEEGSSSGGGMEERNANQSLGVRYAQDFDRIPSKSSGPAYKYVDIVRKKEERQRLKAFDCKECEAFYKDMNLTDEERQERMKNCSRHRAHFSPPSTPEHYWSIGFPDTQTCLQRGYMQVSESTPKPSRRRGPNKYKQLF